MAKDATPVLSRDFIGYGQTPPQPAWPGGARVAVNFVLNYEEGGESTPLDGDPCSEGYLHEIVGAPATVGARNLNTESMYEFGSRAGFWRVHRLFTQREMPLTVYGVGQALARNPAAARAMADAGWEVASHGWRWIDYRDMPEAEERDHIRQTVATITRICGAPPLGWYTGRYSDNTRRLVMEETETLYDSDSYNDDLPYWTQVSGKPRLIVPYALDTNDFKFATSPGWMSGDDFFTYLKAAFDQLYREGEHEPKMLSIGLHCRLAGRPARADALARFMDYVQRHPQVWVCKRVEIARHWMERFPR